MISRAPIPDGFRSCGFPCFPLPCPFALYDDRPRRKVGLSSAATHFVTVDLPSWYNSPSWERVERKTGCGCTASAGICPRSFESVIANFDNICYNSLAANLQQNGGEFLGVHSHFYSLRIGRRCQLLRLQVDGAREIKQHPSRRLGQPK